MSEEKPGDGQQEEVYTLEQVASILKIAESTARAIIENGDLPAFRVGLRRLIRVKRSDLDAYMSGGLI